MKPYTDTLDSLLSNHHTRIQDLGERIRLEVIQLFCDKHKLTFTSGMGTFFFSRGEINYSPKYRMPTGLLGREMQAIFDLLDSEVAYNDCLGFYVGDV